SWPDSWAISETSGWRALWHMYQSALAAILGCSLSLALVYFHTSVYFHGKPKLLEKATARRTAHRVMAKKKHKKDPGKKHKASRSAQGKQRQARRDSWNTTRRQVIKVPEGAVLRGCKK
ncbi:hypothetical protein HaLaN_07871, partial [Haematococcus lacustris]